MQKNTIRRRKKRSLVWHAKRLWSIPIIRILTAAALLALLAYLMFFSGCGKQDEASGTVSEDNSSDVVSDTVSYPETSDAPASAVVSLVFTDATDDLTDVIRSDAGIAVRVSDMTVLGGKNMTGRIYPASMTKIMTVIVAVESGVPLDTPFTLTYDIINPYYLAGSTITGITAGDTVTFADLLYGAVLESGCDATEAIAILVAGSEEAFAERMNAKAKEIGCTETHFSNASGMYDSENYSTLGDMAIMLCYAMKNETAAALFSAAEYTTAATPKNSAGYTFRSTMFGRVNGDEVTGVTITAGKTGYLSETGHCLASYAVSNTGEAYVCVTVGGATRWHPVYDCRDIYGRYASEPDTSSAPEVSLSDG